MPAGRKEQQAAYCSGEPQCCAASQGDGAPKPPESSQPAGLSVLRRFVPPLPSPEQQALCNPCPFSSPLTVGKSFKAPSFLLSQSNQLWEPVLHNWLESQSLTLLFNPFNLHSTMQCGFVFTEEISRARYSAVLGFYSLPALFLFLTTVSWGRGNAWSCWVPALLLYPFVT